MRSQRTTSLYPWDIYRITELYEKIKGEHTYLIGDAKRPTNVMDAIWAAYDIAREL